MELQNSHATVRLNPIGFLQNLITGISSHYLYTQNFQAYLLPFLLPQQQRSHTERTGDKVVVEKRNGIIRFT